MVRNYLPYALQRELFGDRRQYPAPADLTDPDWERWQKAYLEFYRQAQNSPTASKVNASGYRVLQQSDLEGKQVAEIGPGNGPHFRFFRGKPSLYHALDVKPEFLEETRLAARGLFPLKTHLLSQNEAILPLETEALDVFLSFFSLEHLWPLQDWLDEIFRTLRPGGVLVGSIPAEGGIAWGLGRWLTTRRSLLRDHGLDMRKIICWEHVNMCDEILYELEQRGELSQTRWPVSSLPADLSLTIRFAVKKS